MALVSASSSSTTTVAALPRNGQRASSSFLGGKTLLKQATEAARPSFAVRAAADPDRPIWFPGSTPPPWLDGRSAADPDPWSRLPSIR
jgi:light-harvesting complex I chlorophyll a/b binding protein 2